MSDTGFTPPPPPPPPPPPSGGGGGTLPPRGLGDILSTAFEVYKANATKLIVIVAIVVVPLALLTSLFSNVVFDVDTTTVDIGGQPVTTIETQGAFTALIAAAIGAVIAFVMSFVLQAAVMRAAAQAVIGDPVDAEASYRYGFKRLGSVILVSLLVGLILLGGFILLIIPGIIFAVFLAVTIPALVVENKRGTDALGRSWNLVKGAFWHVLGTIVVAGIIAGLVSGIISAIGGDNFVVSWIFTSIGQIITVPFSALVSVILYLDLRARQESLTAERLRSEIALGA
jgi:hypothetical protein